MTRQIQGSLPAAVSPQNESKTETAVAPQPAPAPPEHCDALAGALPAWDLLPASPFIRRVR
ncbi:hypothetical protein DDE05_31360 [Streptomyces cavourensis]|jgi:hypothetical protein|uniref:hypothetical protein n=1 Tax=unclassified Achromobacter TaxID=2626865 RepID=UPI000DFAA7D0|nr:hypothetical protein DDE05_31360 [Streptomyces cavourensis]